MADIPDPVAGLSFRLAKIEAEIAGILPSNAGRQWVRDVAGSDLPVETRLMDLINEPGRALVERGGKRWRPLVLLLAGELARELANIPETGSGRTAGSAIDAISPGCDPVLSLTPLVELAHNGSLIIDDIEDGAEERRGQPAVHLQFGIDLAVNAGNHLYYLPTTLIDAADLPDPVKLELYRIYLRYMRRLHLGQGLDILWHRDHHTVPSETEYLAMCRMKTGCLAAMGAELGAVAGGGSAEFASRLGSLFEDAGVAFQILDDVRNLTTGNPGKRRGDDIVEGKKSLPVILHLSGHPGDAGLFASRFSAASRKGIELSTGEIDELIRILGSSGSIGEAENRARTMIEGIRDHLKSSFAGLLPGTLLIELLKSFLR